MINPISATVKWSVVLHQSVVEKSQYEANYETHANRKSKLSIFISLTADVLQIHMSKVWRCVSKQHTQKKNLPRTHSLLSAF